MKVSLVNDALKMAIKRRFPERGLIWHRDRIGLKSEVLKRTTWNY